MIRNTDQLLHSFNCGKSPQRPPLPFLSNPSPPESSFVTVKAEPAIPAPAAPNVHVQSNTNPFAVPQPPSLQPRVTNSEDSGNPMEMFAVPMPMQYPPPPVVENQHSTSSIDDTVEELKSQLEAICKVSNRGQQKTAVPQTGPGKYVPLPRYADEEEDDEWSDPSDLEDDDELNAPNDSVQVSDTKPKLKPPPPPQPPQPVRVISADPLEPDLEQPQAVSPVRIQVSPNPGAGLQPSNPGWKNPYQFHPPPASAPPPPPLPSKPAVSNYNPYSATSLQEEPKFPFAAPVQQMPPPPPPPNWKPAPPVTVSVEPVQPPPLPPQNCMHCGFQVADLEKHLPHCNARPQLQPRPPSSPPRMRQPPLPPQTYTCEICNMTMNLNEKDDHLFAHTFDQEGSEQPKLQPTVSGASEEMDEDLKKAIEASLQAPIDSEYERMVCLRDIPTVSLATDMGGNTECQICLIEFSIGDSVIFLPKCLHPYHEHCIKDWAEKSNKCPECMTEAFIPD